MMIIVLVVLAVVSWLVVALIAHPETERSGSLASGFTSAMLRARDAARPLLVAAGREARSVAHIAHQRLHRPRVATLEPGWSVPTSARVARLRGDGVRARVVALLQLILFVVLISALFAGVIAAAALRIGHLGA